MAMIRGAHIFMVEIARLCRVGRSTWVVFGYLIANAVWQAMHVTQPPTGVLWPGLRLSPPFTPWNVMLYVSVPLAIMLSIGPPGAALEPTWREMVLSRGGTRRTYFFAALGAWYGAGTLVGLGWIGLSVLIRLTLPGSPPWVDLGSVGLAFIALLWLYLTTWLVAITRWPGPGTAWGLTAIGTYAMALLLVAHAPGPWWCPPWAGAFISQTRPVPVFLLQVAIAVLMAGGWTYLRWTRGVE